MDPAESDNFCGAGVDGGGVQWVWGGPSAGGSHPPEFQVMTHGLMASPGMETLWSNQTVGPGGL